MAAGGSINPLRQQMINMMYLVLMALLALNVSADILKAFAVVNKGLDKTNVNYEQKNALTMAQFQDLLKVDKDAAQKYYNNALTARDASDRMFNYLESLKEGIAARSGGWTADGEKSTVLHDDDLEVSTRYFMNDGHAGRLRDSLKAYVAAMKGLLDNPNAIPIRLDTEDPIFAPGADKKTWASYYWEGVPSVAAITELDKFQNDIRNTEAEVTNYNIGRVGQANYNFDHLQAVISSETPVLSAGQDYQAKVFLGAISSTTIPRISINGVSQKVENGMVEYKEPASTGGTKTLNVSITVPNPHHPGQDTTYITKSEYTVFAGASTISAENMNVLYVGLKNPIAVSAAGFTPQQTFIIFSDKGQLTEVAPGHYTFNPAQANKKITATCYVRMNDGTVRQMGQPMVYRVRNVPRPEILFGTNPGGNISKGEVLITKRINIGLGESFTFDGVPCKINSYKLMIANPKTGVPYIENVTGSQLSANALERLRNVHKGDLIVIASVDCTVAGVNKNLAGPTLTVIN